MVKVDKVFHKLSTVAGPSILVTKKVKTFYDEMKISGMCISSQGHYL